MTKFHINPATGEASRCSAVKGNCPFASADEHFPSAAKARAAYETAHADETFGATKSVFTRSEFGEVFNTNSLYHWPTVAVNVPKDVSALHDGASDVFIDPHEAQSKFRDLATLFKGACSTAADPKTKAVGRKNVSEALELIADAAESLNRDEAYAALNLMSAIRGDKQLRQFGVPNLPDAHEELLSHWGASRDPKTDRYPGSGEAQLLAKDLYSLRVAEELLRLDPATGEDEDRKMLDRVTFDALRTNHRFMEALDRSGRKSGPWRGFQSEKASPEAVALARELLGKAIATKNLQAREIELLEKIFAANDAV